MVFSGVGWKRNAISGGWAHSFTWICAHPNGLSYGCGCRYYADGFVVDVTKGCSVGNYISMGAHLTLPRLRKAPVHLGEEIVG